MRKKVFSNANIAHVLHDEIIVAAREEIVEEVDEFMKECIESVTISYVSLFGVVKLLVEVSMAPVHYCFPHAASDAKSPCSGQLVQPSG